MTESTWSNQTEHETVTSLVGRCFIYVHRAQSEHDCLRHSSRFNRKIPAGDVGTCRLVGLAWKEWCHRQENQSRSRLKTCCDFFFFFADLCLIARCEICIWGMATNGNGSIEVIKKFIFISNAVSSMWVDFLMRDLQSVIAYWCFQEDTWIICRMK